MEVGYLEKEHAKELFSFHAFGGAMNMSGGAINVREGFENVSDEIVVACAGLPLSLEVMGGFLRTKASLDIWNEALQRLHDGKALEGGKENEFLWTRLRICYEDLQEEEKDLFLDIACFFSSNSQLEQNSPSRCSNDSILISTGIRIWKSESPKIGLQKLVKVTEDGSLHMHDQLRDMGRMIMKDVGGKSMERVSCLWDAKEAIAFLQDICTLSSSMWQVTRSLEGLSLVGCEDMPFLNSNKNEQKWFPYLRLLNLSLTQPNIVEFCIGQRLSNLRWLCLRCSSIQKLPNGIANCSRLHVLNLWGCKVLETFPDSIGQLGHLLELDLSWCQMLRTLPSSIGGLSQLEMLKMTNCVHVEYLPESIGQLSLLQNLNLS